MLLPSYVNLLEIWVLHKKEHPENQSNSPQIRKVRTSDLVTKPGLQMTVKNSHKQ